VVAGPNGSGKSSLIKLMLGLLSPKRGLVRADGIELRQLSQEWWRSHWTRKVTSGSSPRSQ
jgi:ABC-type bacteriocin/lantibiotic exporter with double-glycine peptidase domain